MSRTNVLTLALLLMIGVLGCDSGQGNKAPVIEDISLDPANPTEADPKVVITATVTDPDDDLLGYSWTADGGKLLNASGNPAEWSSEGEPGEYEIECSVSDGEATTKETVTFTVGLSDSPS